MIASGHSGQAALPPVLGLVKSTDEGETWQSISGLGKADYHEIEVAGDRIFALRNEDPGMIQVSADGGKTWKSREAPSVATPIDITVNPANAGPVGGLDRPGRRSSPPTAASPGASGTRPSAPRIAWAKPRRALPRRQGRQGQEERRRRDERGRRSARSAPGPRELTFGPEGELYASVAGGEVRRSTDGGKTWTKVIAIGA